MGRRRRVAGCGWWALLLAAACGRETDDPAARQSVIEATITAEVRSRIVEMGELRALRLAVDTRGATVSVRGEVSDSSQARAVGAIARAVRGVEDVRLDLRIVPVDSSARPRSPAEPPPRGAPQPAGAPSDPAEPLPPLDEAG